MVDLAWLIDWAERAVIRWEVYYEEWTFEHCDDARWIRLMADMAKLDLWRLRDAGDMCLPSDTGAKALASFANDIAMWRGMPTQTVWNCGDLQKLTKKRGQP